MRDPAFPSDAFRLGSLVVVPSLNRLARGEQTADVEPRVMGVLAALAQTPGEVVTRAALFEAVWADAVVNDEALTRAVSELRKALGDDAPGAVETIRGTGYRLALPVRPLAPVEAAGTTGDEPLARPEARAQRGALALVSLAVAALALTVAVWAAWPRVALDSSAASTARLDAAGPPRLDSTSTYYRPGMSELGVYYDSTTGRYFRFEPLSLPAR